MIFISDANTYFSSPQDIRQIEHMYPPDDFILGILLSSICPPAAGRAGKPSRWRSKDLSLKKNISRAGISHMMSLDLDRPDWERQVSAEVPAIGHRVDLRGAYAGGESLRRLFRTIKDRFFIVTPDDSRLALTEECIKAHESCLQNGNTLMLSHLGGFSALPRIKSASRTLVDISGFHSPHVLLPAMDRFPGSLKGLGGIRKLLSRNPKSLAQVLRRKFVLGKPADPDTILSNILRDNLSAFRTAFTGLVDYLGEEKIVFGSGLPMFWPEHALLLLTGMTPSSRAKILHDNISTTVRNNPVYRKEYRTYFKEPEIMFLPPYSADSPKCTAARCIRDGQARRRPSLNGFRGVLLAPSAQACLSRLDADRASREGLLFVDGPWELLHITASKVQANGGQVRRLPHTLEPCNKYYRKNSPVYYESSYKFSTAEAAAYSLSILGWLDEGRAIAMSQGFTDKFDRGIGLA